LAETGSLPAAPYGDKCKEAITIPIRDGNHETIGVVTIGISPYRKLDAAYQDFLESLAKNLSANLINARAYEMERKLRIDAERLAAIVASSDDAIISKDLNGIIKSWNKSAERMFGYPAEEAIGNHITLIIPKDRRDEEADILARLRRGERIDHFRTVRVRKDGTSLDISLSISPIRDSTGRVMGASKVARDITAQRRVEQTLREHRERFELIAQASQIGFWFCDLPFDKLIWDNRVKEHFGLPPEADVTIEDFYVRLHPEDRERTRQAINSSIENDKPYDIEYRTVAPDGRVR
jgi:PAS domain S-box-containing protein